MLSVIPCYALQAEKGGLKPSYSAGLNPQLRPQSRSPSEAQIQLAKEAAKTGVQIEWDSHLGTPFSIRGKDLGQRRSFSRGKGLVLKGKDLYRQNAVAVFDNLAGLFRIRDAETEFAPTKTDHDFLGFHHVRVVQVYHGLRVIGGQLIVHFNDSGDAYEVNGNYVSDIDLDIIPGFDEAQAVKLAQADLMGPGNAGAKIIKGPELVIFAFNTEPRLAYELTLGYSEQTKCGQWRYWVDALDGTILLCFNDVKTISPPTDDGYHVAVTGNILSGEGGSSTTVTGWYENTGYYYLVNTNQHWTIYNVATNGYTDNDTYAYRSTAGWGTSDRAEMSAADNFDAVQEYYNTIHNRSSFDNSNACAKANVHEGTDYVNAYWDGTDFHFGDGDGTEADPLAVLDVCGHEFTHAVTEYSADLFYYGESGAINESFSDIFGVCIEFYAQPDGRSLYPSVSPGYSDWLIGEDCWLAATALRDIRNPGSTITVGISDKLASRYRGTYWYYGTGDNAGVHKNMSVQSFAFYLLCEGGSGTNDGLPYAVTGIGITNAGKIAYRALTVYCSEYTDYTEARSAWISAARDFSANWVISVSQAWDAIGVGTDSASASLGSAVNAPSLTWYTGGTADWFAETSFTHDDADAAQSGNIGNGRQSRIYTTVTGPGTLFFWWKVSSEANFDFLRFYINDVEQAVISGAVDWQQQYFSIPAGIHVLKWKYTKDQSVSSGYDASWLDQVTWLATPSPSERTIKNDFDGDGKTDLAVYQESTGYWFIIYSSTYSLSYIKLGESGYTPVPGDFDGDGRTDLAVYQESTGYWFIMLSSTFALSYYKLGEFGYRPAHGDFDGDGKTDLAVYQESTGYWFIIYSSTYSLSYIKLGESGYTPASGDFDGDGKTDLAVYQESTGYWFIIYSSTYSLSYIKLGESGYTPVPGDFDGDGRTDLAVYQESTGYWFIMLSSTFVLSYYKLGEFGYMPVPGDFDGDGKTDLAVYQESTGYWFIILSSSGALSYQKFGETGYASVW